MSDTIKTLATKNNALIGIVLVTALSLPVILVWTAETTVEQDDSTEIVNRVIEDELNAVGQINEEARLLARAKQLEIKNMTDKLKEELLQLDMEIRAWDAEIQPLLDSEQGKLIATNPTYARAYDMLLRKPRWSESDSLARQEIVITLTKPVYDVVGPSTYIPSPDLLTELQRHAQEVSTELREFIADRSQIEAMLDMSRRDHEAAAIRHAALVEDPLPKPNDSRTPATHSSPAQRPDTAPPSATSVSATNSQHLALDENGNSHSEQSEELTLREALNKERQKEAAKNAERIAEKEDEARRVVAKQIAAQRVKQISLEGNRQVQSMQRQSLRDMAADSTIQALFVPFLAQGKNRVGIMNQHMFRQPGPASLADLQSGRVLKSAESFADCGSGRSKRCHNNDRPRWPRPQTAADWKEMERRYELFQKLAPFWIESGVLRR